MTQTTYPTSTSGILTAAEWSAMFKHIRGTGVLKAQLNGLAAFGDSTGMNVKVGSGQAMLLGHFYQSDAQEQLAIAASHATLGRIDRVVLRLTQGSGPAALAVLTGTPNATPSLGMAALTQNASTWEIPIARVTVDAGVSTIAANKVANDRQYAAPWALQAGASAVFTTSSTVYVDVTSSVLTFHTSGGDLQCVFGSSAYPDAANLDLLMAYKLDASGDVNLTTHRMASSANNRHQITLPFLLEAVPAGEHTLQIRMRVSGTGTIGLDVTRKLIVQEMPW